MYLETRVADIGSLLKHSDRNISAKKDSMKFSSFPVKSAAMRHTGKDFAIKISRSFRGKRDALDAFNRMLEPAFEVLHPKPRRKKHRRKKPQKKAKSGHEELIGITEPGEEDARSASPPTWARSAARRSACTCRSRRCRSGSRRSRRRWARDCSSARRAG